MITRYFQHDVEDAVRIAIVTGKDEDEIYSGAGFRAKDEIESEDLPDNFANWKRYTAFCKGAVVEVMSENGD